MNKVLEILKNCREKGQKRAGGLDLDEAIAELEEAMKPKTCEGCKYGVFESKIKYVSVMDEQMECCLVCVRNTEDYFEPKEK